MMEKLRKGYRQTDIGVIPEDWEVRNLSSLGNFYKGNGISKSETNSGEIGAVRYGELYTHYNDYISDVKAFISSNVAKNAKKVQYGDVLFAGSGETKEEIGKCATLLYDKECYAGGDIIIFRPKNCNSLLLGFLLNVPYVQSQKASKGQGDAVVHISTTSLGELIIAIPPAHKEQQAIASTLSDIDSLIEALDKKIAKKRAIKEGVMQQLLTSKKRLAGFTDPWVEKKLGEISGIIMGQSPMSQYYNNNKIGLPLIQGNADIENRKTIIRNYTTQITKRCDEGDVLLSVRAPVGAVAKAEFEACIGRGICAIKTDNDFLYHYLLYIENEWDKYSKGSTFDSINSNELKNTEIYLPKSKEEEQAIAQILTDMDNEIEQLEKERQKYTALKQGAMQQLLTGQIRLLTANQAQLKEKPQKQTNVHFKRSVWAAEIVDRLCDEPTFGHVKMEKLIFLTEHLCGVDIGSNYHRDAAGPYDNRAIRSIDSQLKKQNWFEVVRKDKGYRYIPLSKRGGHKDYFNQYYSDVVPAFDKVINTLRSWNTERCEIVATLYSAWKDLADAKKQYTDNDIINEVLTNWNESKKRIPAERWQKALNWMRENGFTPIKI
jgi:type I restriction enzyme S subunit